ncbi:hypothetical protein [Microbacterium sp.]|nr:hypothetical protein [Microbacterium sp.]
MSTFNRTLIATTAVAIVMLVIAGFLIGSLSNRASATDAVPVALVNLDEPVTVGEGDDEQTIAAGRLLAAEITHGSDSLLAWTIIDGEAADVSLEEYAAVVTIPETFSETISGLREGTPDTASITLETDAPTSPVAARVATEVTTASTQVFDDDFTSTYLEGLLLSYDGISDAVGESREGAVALADAAGDIADASASLADGAAQVASGTQAAQDGAWSLADGAASAQDGATGVSDGASSLAASLSALSSSSSSTLIPAAEASASASAGVTTALATLANACPPTAGAAYCAQVAAAAQASTGAAQASSGTAAAAAGITDALGASAVGAASLADGAASSATGTGSVTAGAVSLAEAMAELSSSTGSLSQGASDLSAGAVSLADGADSLAGGLAELEEAVPTYGEDAAVELAEAVASPTSIDAIGQDAAGRTAFAALGVGVALWIAIALMFQRRPAVPEWALASGGSTLRVVLLGFAPRAAIAATAGFVLWLALLAAGATGSGAGALLGVIIPGAIVLTAVLQGIHAVFGRRAWVVVVGLGIVQVIAASLYAPLATAPGILQSMSDALPLSIVMKLARDAVFGSQLAGSGAGMTLAVWLVATLTASTFAARLHASRRAARRAIVGETAAASGVA